MKRIGIACLVIGILLLVANQSFSLCTSDQISKLKESGYTETEIANLCESCSTNEIINLSLSGKSKKEIDSYCTTDYIKKEDKVPFGRMLFLKSMTLSSEYLYTNEALETKDNTLITERTGIDAFNLNLTWELPISTIYYLSVDTPKKKPPYLTKNITLYSEGNYGNTITDNTITGINIKTETSLKYVIGIKFKATLDTIIPDGKEYKSSEKYIK